MPIPRLDPEAGLARGCGERAHQESSSKHLIIVKCPEDRWPPCRGIWRPPLSGNPCRGKCSRRPRLPGPLMAAGAQRTSTRRSPSSAPLPPPFRRGRRLALPTLSGGGTLMAVPVGTAPAPHTVPVGMVRVHPPAATPNVRDPFRVAGAGPGATPTPGPQHPLHTNGSSGILTRGWHLRLWAPFSLSSDFLFLLPFVCLPGELRAFALLGAPLLPLPSRTPPPSWPRGYGRAPLPAVPLRERGRWSSLHHPLGVAPFGPGEVQERHPPHPGGHDAAVPRRLSSALPILPLAPPGSCPGDWDTAAAGPGGPVSHEATRLGDLS
jgi:hypothetical protein